jgi:hypothetical protein
MSGSVLMLRYSLGIEGVKGWAFMLSMIIILARVTSVLPLPK